jgi:hypothetical protein
MNLQCNVSEKANRAAFLLLAESRVDIKSTKLFNFYLGHT